eukprot:2834509-Pyramimonas_sp.AAC.1
MPLGTSRGPGPREGLLGRLRAIVEASWAALRCRKPEEAGMRRSSRNPRETNRVDLFRPCW